MKLVRKGLPAEFFWLFVRRDLRMRYAGSLLGALWNLIHPLVMVGLYIMIFSSIMSSRTGGGGLNYAVHLCAGLIPWLLFSDVLTRSVATLLENGNFLKKAAFPPLALFLALLFNAMAIYGAAWIGFLALLAVFGAPPPASALAALGVMALFGVSGMGIGLALAAMNVLIRDTAQGLTVAMQILFWLNPIVYFKASIRAFDPATPAASLPALERIGRVLVAINPFERFVSASQWLTGQASSAPGAGDWLIIILFPAVCVVAGSFVFRRLLPEVRDSL